MSNTLKLGNGQWATGKDTILAYNDLNSNYKPLAFSFSRNSSATVTNKDGLIETVGSGEPRIDFKDNTKGALLLEPQSTNLVLESNNFNNYFTKINDASVQSNQVISPDGTLNADKIIRGSADLSLRRNSQVATGTEYTFSIYAKKGTASSIRLDIGDEGMTTFNLTDYWQRFNVKATPSSYGHIDIEIPNANQGDYIYVFGAMVEQNSYATSYISTSGQANGVTRVADSSSQTLPSSVFNSYPFSVFAEVDVVDTSNGYAFSLLNKASSNNYFTIEYYSNKWHIVARPSGSTITRSSLEILTKGTHKLVGVYTDTNLKLYLNGSLIASGSNTQSFNSNVDSLLLGQLRISGDTNSRNTIRQTYLYNNELTDAEAIALTS